jgi:TolB protein
MQGEGRINFLSNRDGNWEIYTMTIDGSNLRNVTNHPADDGVFGLSWLSSQTLAFTTNRDGNWEIYRMDVDGTNLVNLTNNPARDVNPRWIISPIPHTEAVAGQ